MFSHPEVQALIRDRFVAAWQSVRPVPKVTIDFGNGHVLRRTLNGNVATYVCDPDGHVVDVIPGLCDPDEYLAQLREALALYEATRSDPTGRARAERHRVAARAA